ncbi:MAG TPA: carbohydrate ABC transporter permease, partial [Candidatus Methylomirabilis sp.]
MIVASRSPAKAALVTMVIVVALIWTLFPLYYLFLTSVKSIRTIMERPPRLIVWPSFETYEHIIFKEQFYQFFVNSFIIASGSTILALIIGGTAAFAFSHWKFRGKEPLFLVSMVGRMFPPITTLIPIYLMVKFSNLVDTHIALILIYASFQVPLVLLILRDFFSQVPRELSESAYIDGCSPWQVFVRIILPLAKNGIVAAAILCFVEAWNEFIFALTFMADQDNYTVAVGLRPFFGQYGTDWGALMAGSTL